MENNKINKGGLNMKKLKGKFDFKNVASNLIKKDGARTKKLY